MIALAKPGYAMQKVSLVVNSGNSFCFGYRQQGLIADPDNRFTGQKVPPMLLRRYLLSLRLRERVMIAFAVRPDTSTGFDRAAYRQFAWLGGFLMLRGHRPRAPQSNYAGSRSCCHHSSCHRQTIEKTQDKQESRTADKQISRVSSYPPHSRADTSSVRAF